MSVSAGSTGPTGYTSSLISSIVPDVATPVVDSKISFVEFAVYSHPYPYSEPGLMNRGNTYTPASRRPASRTLVVDPVTEPGKYSP